MLNWYFNSTLPGVSWPAVSTPQNVTELALLFQMEQTQWLPADILARHQFEQLHPLLAHAYGTVPFYRDRLAAAGFSPNRPLTPEVFSRLPPLTRSDVQQQGKALLSRSPLASHGPLIEYRTAGSTGQPLTVAGNPLTAMIRSVLTLRDHLWHRRDLGGRLAVIRDMAAAAAPDGLLAENWGDATTDLCRTGSSGILRAGTEVARQIDWLRRFDPAYLLTDPGTLSALTRFALDERIALPGLKEIRTTGAVVTPELRAICREAWGVPLTDRYSVGETGDLAMQCPDHEHLHVQSEAVLLEVIDAAGNPCAPGETGRVVLTPLHNFAMPLIRYEIGDHAEVGAPCPCGRGLPVLKRIGRAEHSFPTVA